MIMNTAKITLTATILAAALGLALGLGAAPALADPATEGEDHRHGKGAISDADPPWAVSIVDLKVNGSDPLSPCPGTPVQNKDTLAADFDTGCIIFMTSDGTDIGDFGLSLFRVELRIKIKGSGLSEAMLAFTTNPDFTIGDIAEVWSTDRMTVDITEDDPFLGWITLTPSPPGLSAGPLTKEHQPGKGDVTDQNVSFSEIVYEPIN